MGLAKTLKQDWKVKTDTNTHRLQKSDNTRANTMKTKVITREPQTILNNIEQVTKDTRTVLSSWLLNPNNTWRHLREGAKHHQRNISDWSQGRVDWASGQSKNRWTKVSLTGLRKTNQGDRVAEGNKPGRSIKNTMSNLPGQVNDVAIKIEEKELPSSTRPIQSAKLRKELRYTMGVTWAADKM